MLLRLIGIWIPTFFEEVFDGYRQDCLAKSSLSSKKRKSRSSIFDSWIFPGIWQHFSITPHEIDEEAFEKGLGFDGSSIRGWQAINESDMLVKPVPDTAFVDPFLKAKTLVMICNICDPITGEDYTRDPRNIARKAEAYLEAAGWPRSPISAPSASSSSSTTSATTRTSTRATTTSTPPRAGGTPAAIETPGNLGYKIRLKEGYFPVPPSDSLQDVRSDMMLTLESIGVPIEVQHHEVATAGQAEIDMRFNTLLTMADNVLKYKYVAKNTAKKYGKVVTFMPKPLFGDNGSGMHVHFSLWNGGKNLFAGDGYAGMSQMAHVRHRRHPQARALDPRLRHPDDEQLQAPRARLRGARSTSPIPAATAAPRCASRCTPPRPKAKRFEFRCPDPSCNPYLTFSAMLMAAMDGIANKIDPGKPLDKDIYDLPPEELAAVPKAPGSLREVLKALENDHAYLLKGDVFTEDVIETWIDYKMKNEVQPLELRPHPWEFMLYFDI